MSVLAGAEMADYVSSVEIIGSGRLYHETDPLFGRYPSGGRFALLGATYFTGEVLLARGLKRYGQEHRWARHLWLLEPGAMIVARGIVTTHHNLSEPKMP
jgi:hypothetical protein